MHVVHLTDSPFFGGPERQMLGLAKALPSTIRTSFLCFRDGGASTPFLQRLTESGITAVPLRHVNPNVAGMLADIRREVRSREADVLVCHGYKADLLGWPAARSMGLPVVSVSRGWTGHTSKVRLYEALDRRVLRRMDAVVCVSEGQAAKVRAAGVDPARIRVIRNAIDVERFPGGREPARRALESLFARRPGLIVAGIGRLSPEKAFERLVDAAAIVVRECPEAGFIIIGDGPSRSSLEARIRALGLGDSVVLAGFRSDVDALVPGIDVLAQSSRTEGLPNVVLEACAACVPVVATDVGGTAEVVREGINGHLVPPDDPRLLADRLLSLLRSPEQRRELGARGRELVRTEFSFTEQSAAYMKLFDEVARLGAARIARESRRRAVAPGART